MRIDRSIILYFISHYFSISYTSSCSNAKDDITRSKASLEEQLNNIISRIANLSKDGSPLEKIKEVNDRMDERGITNNKYTTLVAKDVQVQWEQYQAFLERKKNMLEAEIAHQKLRGITPEQFKEIEDTFKQYDTDNSGSIDRKELKALLYALGMYLYCLIFYIYILFNNVSVSNRIRSSHPFFLHSNLLIYLLLIV